MFDVAAFCRSERAKGEEEKYPADPEHNRADDCDDDDRVLEIGLQCGETVPMTHPAPQAAIFDFDETIIDLEKQHAAASSALCRAMGNRYEDLSDSYRSMSGRRVIDEIRDMRGYFGWKRSVEDLLAERQRYFDHEIASSADLKLMTGAEAFIRDLHARNMRLAIATSAVRKSIETILRRFDLLQLFEVIVDGSEVERGKPDPQVFLITAQRLRADPAACIVFEDSEVGVRAAKAAGMVCVAVRNPNAQTKQNLDPADLIVNSFGEIDVERLVTSLPSSR